MVEEVRDDELGDEGGEGFDEDDDPARVGNDEVVGGEDDEGDDCVDEACFCICQLVFRSVVSLGSLWINAPRMAKPRYDGSVVPQHRLRGGIMMAAKTESLTQSPTKGRAKARPRPSMYIGKKSREDYKEEDEQQRGSKCGLNVDTSA